MHEVEKLRGQLKEALASSRDMEREYEEKYERELGEMCDKLRHEEESNAMLASELAEIKQQLQVSNRCTMILLSRCAVQTVEADRDACRTRLIELEADLKKSAVDAEKNAQLMQQISEKQKQTIATPDPLSDPTAIAKQRIIQHTSEMNSKRDRSALESSNCAETSKVSSIDDQPNEKIPRKPRKSGRIKKMRNGPSPSDSQTDSMERSAIRTHWVPSRYW